MADSNVLELPAPAAPPAPDTSAADAVPFGYFQSGGNLYRLANPYPTAAMRNGSTEVHPEDMASFLAGEQTPWQKAGKIPAVRQGEPGAEGPVSGAAALPDGGAPPTQTTDTTAPALGAAAQGTAAGGSMWGMPQAAAATPPPVPGDAQAGGKWDPASFGLKAPAGAAAQGAPTGAAQGAPTGAATGAAAGQWDPKAFGLGPPAAAAPPPPPPPAQPQAHTGMLANIGAGLLTGAGMVGDVFSDPVGTLIAKPATIIGVTAYDALMHAMGKPGMPADLRKDLMGDATAAGPATGALFAGAEALGAPPIASIQPANNWERAARDIATGGVAGIALGPQNLVRNAITGAAGVVGGDVAGEAAPEGYKEAAGLAGMVAGGATPHLVEAAGTRLPGATLYSQAARERSVARTLRRDVGNAPIETSPVGPTDLAQSTNVARVQGKVEYAKGIPEGSGTAAALHERIRNAVDTAIRFIGGGQTVTRPESSAEFTRFYRQIEEVAGNEASRLWNVPELADLEVSPSAVQQAVAAAEAQIPPEMHAAMSPQIGALLGQLRRSGPTTVKDLNIIRSKLLKVARENQDGMQRSMAGDLASAFLDGFDSTPEIAGQPPQPTGTHTMVRDPVTGQITTTPDMSPGVPPNPAIRGAYDRARDFTRRMKDMFADKRSGQILNEAKGQYTKDESAGAQAFFNLSYGTPEGPTSIAELAAYARSLTQQPTAAALADGLVDTARGYFAAALADATRLGEGKTFSPAALRDLMSKNVDWITRSGMFTPEQAQMAMDLLDYARMLDRSRELTAQRTSQTNRLQEQRETFVDRIMNPTARRLLEIGGTLGASWSHGLPGGTAAGVASYAFDLAVRHAETQMRELMARAVLDPAFAAQLMRRPTVQNAAGLNPAAAAVVQRMARNAATFNPTNTPGGSGGAPPAGGGGGGAGRPGNRPNQPAPPAAGAPVAPGGGAGGPGAAPVYYDVAPGAATEGGASPLFGRRGATAPAGPLGSDPLERALTVNDILYGDTPAKPPRSRSVSDIAKELMNRGSTALKALGVSSGRITGPDPVTDEILSRAIASEVKGAVENSENHAGDWYTHRVNEAMSVASLMHPEIATDANAKMAFTAALAVTSQGETVPRNTRLGNLAYETYKNTGRFPTDMKVKDPSINANFRKLNDLLDEMGPDNLNKFLHTKFTVRELQDMGYDAGGENIDTEVHGSAILGAKIGGGFFQNLNGNFDPVTMDLWYMRGWGRLTGTLVGQQNEKAFAKTRDRFTDALAADGRPVPKTLPALERRAEDIASTHERDYKKNRADYDSGARKKSELTYSAERFIAAQSGINETPSSGGKRVWMRSVMNRARELLGQEGYRATNADMQALWWYPEKDLYAKLGGRDSDGINVDYSTAMQDLAKSKGHSDEEITRAVGSASAGSGSAGQADVAPGVEGRGQGGNGGAQAQGAAQANVGAPPEALSFGRRAANGLYSPVERAVEGLKQERGTGEQFAAQLSRTPGVKAEEMKWLGLEDWLKGQKSVTKADIADYVRANRLELNETTKGTQWAPADADEAWDYLTEHGRLSRGMIAEELGIRTGQEAIDEATQQAREYGDVSGATKFSKWQLPGGKNYREMLLQMPEAGVDPRLTEYSRLDEKHFSDGLLPDEMARWKELRALHQKGELGEPSRGFMSQHWEEPNVLAHVRFSDRTAPDGAKVLHVEEIQSDWHQKGRREGYRPDQERELASLQEQREELMGQWHAADRGSSEQFGLTDKLNEINDKIRDIVGKEPGPPDAPFKTSWPALAMKRIIAHAVDNGYDRVSWTPGEEQAARYDLSKHVDRLVWDAKTNHLIADAPDGSSPISQVVPLEKLPDFVGKDVAEKLAAQPVNKDGVRVLEGEGLKVGGEGMKGFYDKILPTETQKIIGKFGGKVEQSPLQEPPDSLVANDSSAHALALGVKTVPSFDITPQMREAVSGEGLPMFKRAAENASTAAPHQDAVQAAIDTASRITGGKVQIEAHDPASDVFTVRFGDKTEQVYGYAVGRLIRAAIEPGRTLQNLGHESVHALRNMGVFTPEEWSKLEGAAQRGKWAEKYGVEERYPGLTPEQHLEEAIADHFAEYVAGEDRNPKTVVGAAVQKVQRFLVQLKSALAGKGFRQAEDIFGDMASGKIGNRGIGSGSAPRGFRTIEGSIAGTNQWLRQGAQGMTP